MLNAPIAALFIVLDLSALTSCFIARSPFFDQLCEQTTMYTNRATAKKIALRNDCRST